MKKLFIFMCAITGSIAATAQSLNTHLLSAAAVNNLPPATDSVVEVAPTTVGPFCPKKLVAGDRDFNGHGPEIWASVKLTFSRSAVLASVQFRAKETAGGDNSETNGVTLKVVYTAPRGFYITELMSGKTAEVHYVCKPGSSTTTFMAGNLAKALNSNVSSMITDKNDGLVSGWEITGDTPGQDISDDDNCDDDTRVKVMLNTIRIKLRKTEGALGIQNIKLEDINEWLVPKKLVRGDREFDGHGPRIKSEVKLRIADGGTKLYADVTFWAQETVHDWSTTEGSWSKLVYEVPYGKKITEIISDKASRTQLISPPGGFQFIVPGADLAKAMYAFLDATDIKSAVLAAHGAKPEEKSLLSALVKGTIDNGNTVVQVPAVEGALVKFFHIVGDTGGNDISDDDNGNDDTRIVKIEFFPVKVKMENTNN